MNAWKKRRLKRLHSCPECGSPNLQISAEKHPVKLYLRASRGYPSAASQEALLSARGRDGRVDEGAPLLRAYRVYSLIEGSNPSLSATSWRVVAVLFYAPVAQLDRVPGYELGGRRFESFRAHHSGIDVSMHCLPKAPGPSGPGLHHSSKHQCRRWGRLAHLAWRSFSAWQPGWL